MKTMTKIYRSNLLSLAMLALLLLGAGGCRKENFVTDIPEQQPGGVTPSHGTTYMSLTLRTTGATNEEDTDPTHNYIKDWEGDDDITSFAVYVVSKDRNEVHCIQGNIAGNPDVQSYQSGILRLIPWPTSPGEKTIYAFLNPPAQYVIYLGETLGDKDQFEKRVAEPIPFQGKAGVTYAAGSEPRLAAFTPDPHIAKKVLPNPKVAIEDVPSFERNMVNLFKLVDTPLGIIFPGSKPGEDLPPFSRWKDHIMCSGIRSGFVPEDQVTKDMAKSGVNRPKMELRRVLAQAVVTADYSLIGKGISKDPELAKMKLKGVSFQVLNFEPEFYPIAKSTDGHWYTNKNTETPSYKELAPRNFIDFETYRPSSDYPDFSSHTLIRDAYLRSVLFPNKAEILPTVKDWTPKLLRRMQLTKGSAIEGTTIPDYSYNEPYETTMWGSCYVTETTHKWGDGTDSEYRKGNTPFFAIIAAFDIPSLPWASATSDGIQSDGAQKEALFNQTVAPWNAEIEQKRQELIPVEASLKPLQDEVERLEAEWKALVTPYIKTDGQKKNLDKILEYREQYKKGEIKDRRAFDRRVSRYIQTV